MDTGVLTEHLRLSQSQYLVYTDGKRFHIFSTANNQLNEISDIPDIEQAGIIDEVADAKHLRNILWNFRITSQDLDSSNTILAMSIQTYREKKWDAIKTSTDSDLLVEVHNRIAKKYPLAVSDTIFQKKADTIINSMLRFEKVRFDGNALCTADVYRKIFCDSTYRIGPKHLIDLMTKFAKGKTAVSSSMQASFIINMSKSKKTVDYYGIAPLQETNVVRFMCRDENVYFNKWFIDKESYDSILMLPPFYMRNYSEVQPGNSLFADRKIDLEYRLIENALNHLNDNGRLVAIVTAGFLRSERNKKLRDHIKSNFHSSTIIELDRPFDGTAINAFLMVIENKPIADCLMSFDPVKRKDLDSLEKLLLGHSPNLLTIPDGLYAVPQIELTESWMPKEYHPIRIKLNKKLADWTPLRDCCELIRGRPVPSESYLDKGTIGGVPYLRISDIQDSEIKLEKCVRVPAKYADVVPKRGDILFSTVGSIGKIALVNDEEFLPSPQIVLLRCKNDYSPEKVFNSLKDPIVGTQIAINIVGSTISNFSTEDVLDLKIRTGEIDV